MPTGSEVEPAGLTCKFGRIAQAAIAARNTARLFRSRAGLLCGNPARCSRFVNFFSVSIRGSSGRTRLFEQIPRAACRCCNPGHCVLRLFCIKRRFCWRSGKTSFSDSAIKRNEFFFKRGPAICPPAGKPYPAKPVNLFSVCRFHGRDGSCANGIPLFNLSFADFVNPNGFHRTA